MKIKNNQLIFYEVDKRYLEYLSEFDSNVRQKSDRRYVGIVVTDRNQDYCVPLTCKIKHRNSKLTMNILDLDTKQTIAQLTINNMIPVNESMLKVVDIDKDKDKDYLRMEQRYFKNDVVIQMLLNKCSNVLDVLHDKSHPDYKFFKKLCGNFKLLEEKCIEYKSKS